MGLLLRGPGHLELGSGKPLGMGNRAYMSVPGNIWQPGLGRPAQISPPGSVRARGDTEKDAISHQRGSELELEVALMADPAADSCGPSLDDGLEASGAAGWGGRMWSENEAYFSEKEKKAKDKKPPNSGEMTKREFYMCSESCDKSGL